FRQRDVAVAALILDGVYLAAVQHDRDREVVVDVDREGAVSLEIGYLADGHEAHSWPWVLVLPWISSSSRSICSSILVSISGTPMRRMMSMKKPCAIRRRASTSSM